MEDVVESASDLFSVDNDADIDCSYACYSGGVAVSKMNRRVVASIVRRKERFIVSHMITIAGVNKPFVGIFRFLGILVFCHQAELRFFLIYLSGLAFGHETDNAIFVALSGDENWGFRRIPLEAWIQMRKLGPAFVFVLSWALAKVAVWTIT